jgi:hypothetical protein
MIDDENNERNGRLNELKMLMKQYAKYLEKKDEELSDDMLLVGRVSIF